LIYLSLERKQLSVFHLHFCHLMILQNPIYINKKYTTLQQVGRFSWWWSRVVYWILDDNSWKLERKHKAVLNICMSVREKGVLMASVLEFIFPGFDTPLSFPLEKLTVFWNQLVEKTKLRFRSFLAQWFMSQFR
jgi:hypothetical protein